MFLRLFCSVPNLHPLPPFLYINRVNLAFRMLRVPRLLKAKDEDLLPVPAKLLAHYFPTSTMALVNDLHAELHRSSAAGNREICVRTRHAGQEIRDVSPRDVRLLRQQSLFGLRPVGYASELCRCGLVQDSVA